MVSGKSLIAMCTAEGGDEMHWEVESERDKTSCPCWDCDCTPRLYVAIDALLSDAPVAAADDAMEHFVEDRAKPVRERDLDSAWAGLSAAVKAVGL